MTMETNNLNHGKPPMTETAVKGIQERINYYTRLALAFLALLAVVGGSLIAEIRKGEYDILFTLGGMLLVLVFGTACYLVARINSLIKKLEEQ